MAMTLEVDCSYHQKKSEARQTHLTIVGPRELDPQSIKERLEAQHWVVQFNGNNMDTYCSKECAR